MIQEDLSRAAPFIAACRHDASQLCSMCGPVGAMELKKRIDELDQLVDDINDGLNDRHLELSTALNNSDNCNNLFEVNIEVLYQLVLLLGGL